MVDTFSEGVKYFYECELGFMSFVNSETEFVTNHTWERPFLCMKQFLIVKVGQGRMININDSIPLSQVISARKGEFETGFERGGQTRWEEVFLFGLFMY